MAENIIPLPGGGSVITDPERKRSISMNIDNLYRYRLVDDNSDVVQGTGVYVPNVDDIIWGFVLGWFRVSRVDYTLFEADLVLWEPPKNESDVGVSDVLLGIGPGYNSESWRVMIDSRAFPFRLDVDAKFRMYAVEAKEIRVFNGINTTASGEVISAYYTDAMDYVNEAIPLALVATRLFDNKAIKAPIMGYTTKKLEDGQLVTVVAYNVAGSPISYAKMLVHNTNLTRHPEEGMKRVKSIELISPYLSKSSPNTLDVPINATVATLAMRAKVTYIDGNFNIMDVVDETANGKFKLLGLKYWSPTLIGRPQDLDLVYQLSESEEYSYLQGETANGMVRQAYRIRGISVDPAFSLKVFAFPYWISSLVGYGMQYWLYDLDRQVARQIPKGAIELDPGSAPIDGLNYTTVQHITIGVNLKAVDVEYGDHRHIQLIQIALLRDGGMAASNWKMKFSGNQAGWYGDGLAAKVKAAGSGLSTVNVGQGAADKAAWLALVYTAIEPLYDPQTELGGLDPTHFVITTKTRTFEVPVAQWNRDLTFVNDLAEGETLYLKWLKRTSTGDLQLGVSGLPLHNV